MNPGAEAIEWDRDRAETTDSAALDRVARSGVGSAGSDEERPPSGTGGRLERVKRREPHRPCRWLSERAGQHVDKLASGTDGADSVAGAEAA